VHHRERLLRVLHRVAIRSGSGGGHQRAGRESPRHGHHRWPTTRTRRLRWCIIEGLWLHRHHPHAATARVRGTCSNSSSTRAWGSHHGPTGMREESCTGEGSERASSKNEALKREIQERPQRSLEKNTYLRLNRAGRTWLWLWLWQLTWHGRQAS